MIWRFVAVVVGGTVLASSSDWLFMGVVTPWLPHPTAGAHTAT